MLSQAIEDYLKTIYKLHDGEVVSKIEIARALDVSSASVTNMVKRLDGMGLVTNQPYHGVSLTDAGKKIALEIIRHHRLLETYLREIMGYDWEKMHDEAEKLEHHISEEFEDRLDEMLGYPTHDPHGDPIPSRDGDIPPRSMSPLTQFSEGESVLIQQLPNSDPVILTRLETMGLLPKTRVMIVKNNSEPDSITVQIGNDECVLEYAQASRILGSSTNVDEPGDALSA